MYISCIISKVNTQDLLNLSLALGIIVITICVVFITFFFVQALKSVSNMTENISDITQNIKEKMQMKALAAIPAILVSLASKIIRRKRG